MVRPALKIGPYAVDPPVVLAPMAGITNTAFRRSCREHGAGLYVCEMITSRALVERNPETMQMIAFDEDERPRSLRLYGVDPATIGAAVRMVADEDLADHIDLNFGCPVLIDSQPCGVPVSPPLADLDSPHATGLTIMRQAGRAGGRDADSARSRWVQEPDRLED